MVSHCYTHICALADPPIASGNSPPSSLLRTTLKAFAERVHRGAHQAPWKTVRFLRAQVSPAPFFTVEHTHNSQPPGAKRRPASPIARPHTPKKPLVSRPSSYMLNAMPKKSSSKRRSRRTTSATSSRPTHPPFPTVLSLLSCLIVRARRTQKPYPVPSNRSARTRLPSTLYLCRKCAALPRTRCSR